MFKDVTKEDLTFWKTECIPLLDPEQVREIQCVKSFFQYRGIRLYLQSVDLQMVGVCVLPKESGGKSFHIIYVTEIGCAMLYIFYIKHSQRVRDVRAYVLDRPPTRGHYLNSHCNFV